MKLTCTTDYFKNLKKGNTYDIEQGETWSVPFGWKKVDYKMVKVNGRWYRKSCFSDEPIYEDDDDF